MEPGDEESAKPTPRTLLGRRLRRMRMGEGLSLRALESEVSYPHTYLSRVERGEQLPSLALAQALDAHFRTHELFVELLTVAQDSTIPDYVQAVLESEDRAIRIQVFDSSLIPGLLQTEDYARELFRISKPNASPAEVEEKVATRMRRKRLFEKSDKPLYWAIIDEAALKRPLGGAHCMADQMSQIIEVAGARHISLQVLPFTHGGHSLMGGTLSLLTLGDGTTIGYAESFISGAVVETPQRVLDLVQNFDVVRCQALSEGESLDLLRNYLREYRDDDDS
ncbi:helix-turn-helix transcriptional regulator [Streptomyces sp. CAU 1734]|uniref:helix-turn-helix domain-containing protein n=1 Tax=Streptomyces sp. CAU 1734 TaxID=3140360 RepID=UPI0032602D1E